jgi:ferredoxin
MVEGKGKTNRNCFGCGLCAHNCPEKAITMKKLRDPLPRDKEGHAPGNYRPGLYWHHEPVREE